MSTTNKKPFPRGKSPLYTSTLFVEELQKIFEVTPKISPASELLEALKNISLPKKWTINTTKAELTKNQVVRYVRTKPAGYILDTERLVELIQLHKIPHLPKIEEIIPPPKKKAPPIQVSSIVKNELVQKLQKPVKKEKLMDQIPAFSSY